jgi:hypothetical protein
VDIAAEKACYPGIAFRAGGSTGYELAYAQPHTSGRWDALQYDPVFNGSNTWQNHFGPPYQKSAAVPSGEWFRLRIDFSGRRAAVRLGNQPPLVIERLSRPLQGGTVGLWSYLPAYYADLRVFDTAQFPPDAGTAPSPFAGAVCEWQLEGCGQVACEASGILNIDRYLPPNVGPARLSHEFSAAGGAVRLSFGFSDELVLLLDGQEIYAGQHTWKVSPEWSEQGYVDYRQNSLTLPLAAGRHTLSAVLGLSEPFGWGLALGIREE